MKAMTDDTVRKIAEGIDRMRVQHGLTVTRDDEKEDSAGEKLDKILSHLGDHGKRMDEMHKCVTDMGKRLDEVEKIAESPATEQPTTTTRMTPKLTKKNAPARSLPTAKRATIVASPIAWRWTVRRLKPRLLKFRRRRMRRCISTASARPRRSSARQFSLTEANASRRAAEHRQGFSVAQIRHHSA
jgi:hypothetical protein